MAKPASTSYREGTWFAVPLRDGGYGVGLIARGRRGHGLFGFFFGPRREKVPTLAEVQNSSPGQAVLVALFSDQALRKKTWPLLGQAKEFDRAHWPMPAFVRTDLISGKHAFIRYDEEDPDIEVDSRAGTAADATRLPMDGLWGHAAIELKLTDILRLVAQLPPLSSPVVPGTSRKTTRRKVAARTAST